MSKGSLLVPVQLCIVQLCLIWSCWPQLIAGHADKAKFLFLRQDPVRSSPWLMSIHGREELDDGQSTDSIFHDEEGRRVVDEFATDVGGGVAVEEDEGWLPNDDGGSGAKGSSSGSGGDVECPECGKFFKNDKSMFGHLRSHPNRGYKGAIPPVNKLKLSPEPDAALPPSPSLSRGTQQPRPRRDRRLIPLELVAPYALLTLQWQDEQATQQAPPPPQCFRDSETNIGGQISSGMVAAEGQADEYGCSVLKIPKKRRNMVREAHRKKAKLMPPPPPKEKGPPYICKHCCAEFSTHQALGGHSAGHHRDIKKDPTLNDATTSSRAHQGMATQIQDGNWKLQVLFGGRPIPPRFSKLQVKGASDDDDGACHSGVSLPRGLPSEQLSMASNVPQQSGQESGGQMIEMRQQHSGRFSFKRKQSGSRGDGLTPTPAPALTPTEADDRGGRRLFNIDLNAEAREQE